MPGTITFDFPTLIQGKRQSVDGGVFEGFLDPDTCTARDNAELTLYMRVHIYDAFDDPAITTKAADQKSGTAKDADGNQFTVYPWPKDKFRLWRSKLITTAQRFWHGKFWLETPASFRGLDWPKSKPTHRPNVWCRL